MRTVMLGLDGAAWDVLEPLIRRGEMPRLKELREESAWGVLKSTVPPVTGRDPLQGQRGKKHAGEEDRLRDQLEDLGYL